MNKFLRFLGYIGVHLLVVIEVYLLALALSSPVVNLVIGTMDAVHKIPAILSGKYLLLWLIVSFVIWIPMFIYTEVKGHLNPKNKKKEK